MKFYRMNDRDKDYFNWLKINFCNFSFFFRCLQFNLGDKLMGNLIIVFEIIFYMDIYLMYYKVFIKKENF